LTDRRVPERSDNCDEEEVLDDIRRIHDDLGRIPTGAELGEYGRFSEIAYRRAGDGRHTVALVRAGIVDEPPTSGTTPVPTEAVLADMCRVRDDLGRWPKSHEYNTYGEHSWQLLGSRLDETFVEVIERAKAYYSEEY